MKCFLTFCFVVWCVRCTDGFLLCFCFKRDVTLCFPQIWEDIIFIYFIGRFVSMSSAIFYLQLLFVHEAEVSMVVSFFSFFLNKRHFWTSSPLNDYKWICLAGTTGSFYKIWQEISLTGICMAQFVLFVSSTQCPRVNRPIARHKEQGQNITSCQEEGGHFKHT